MISCWSEPPLYISGWSSKSDFWYHLHFLAFLYYAQIMIGLCAKIGYVLLLHTSMLINTLTSSRLFVVPLKNSTEVLARRQNCQKATLSNNFKAINRKLGMKNLRRSRFFTSVEKFEVPVLTLFLTCWAYKWAMEYYKGGKYQTRTTFLSIENETEHKRNLREKDSKLELHPLFIEFWWA